LIASLAIILTETMRFLKVYIQSFFSKTAWIQHV